MYSKKSLTKILSIMLMGGLILSSTPFCSSSEISAITNTNKINKKLQEAIKTSSDGETIPVQIIYNDLDHSIIDDELEKSFNLSDYRTRDSFNMNLLPKIIKDTEKKYGYELSHILTTADEQTGEISYKWDNYESDISPLLNNKLSSLKKEVFISNLTEDEKQYLSETCFGTSLIGKNVSENIDYYLDVRRDCVSNTYTEFNTSFANKYDIESDDIIFLPGFAPTLIANVDKDMIKTLSQDPNVINISYFENSPTYDTLSDACNVTDVSTVQGSDYNLGTGYTGANVKIGIVESSSRYDPSYLLLNNVSNLQYIQNGSVTSNVNLHATLVTSILKGKSINYNNKTYRGIAPDAITYQMTAPYVQDVYTAINTLAIDYNVSIINASFSFYDYPYYSNIDWTIDNFIENYGIVFVTSSGNITPERQYVSSPSNAYNAITVGNVNTKSSQPYHIDETSIYLQNQNTSQEGDIYDTPPNKPDVCAPGTMYFPGYSNYTGTSFSSPLVAGIAAQLIQCDPSLKLSDSYNEGKTYYNAVKALIILGCERTCLQEMSTAVFGSNSMLLINNKCGAGIVNAKNSIDALLSRHINIKNINMTVNGTSVGGMGTYAQYRAGTKIKAVLVFSKINQTANNDIDLEIYDSSLNNLKSSSSSYNNVEIIEYIVPADGNYMIMAEMNNISFSDNQTLPGALIIYTE